MVEKLILGSKEEKSPQEQNTWQAHSLFEETSIPMVDGVASL